MRGIFFLSLLLGLCPFAIGQAQKPIAGQAKTPPADSPLVIELGAAKESASDAVLELGFLGVGASSETTLRVRNNSEKPVRVDAFSLGYGLLALWEPPDQTPSSRTVFAPGSQRDLRIRLVSYNDQKLYPSIVFMQDWKEIGHIDVLFTQVYPPQTNEYKFASQQEWYVSDMGKEAAHYRFCTPPAPPGFTISATPRLWESPGDKDDPRGCYSWAKCDPDTPKPGEGACFAPWAQGHSEGDSHVKDRTVLFQFAITVEYRPLPPVWTLTSAKDLLKKPTPTSTP